MGVRHAPPSRVPSGFQLRHRLVGDVSGGFVDSKAEQTTFMHTRSWGRADVIFPLMVSVTSEPNQVLVGTGSRAGVPIDVGVPGTTAIYHDGMWYVEGSVLQEAGLEKARQWRTDLVHSITVHTATSTVGVRAKRDVSIEELVQIVRSLEFD